MGKCSDIETSKETGFLARLSNHLSIHSWGNTSDRKATWTHLVAGACGYLPSTLGQHLLGHQSAFQVSLTPLCLTDMFLASSAVLSLSNTTGHQDWVSVGRFIPRLAPKDVEWGTGCLDKSRSTGPISSIALEEILLVGSYHTSPLEGQRKEMERKQKLIPAWLQCTCSECSLPAK